MIVNCYAGGVLDLYLKKNVPNAPYHTVVDKLLERYDISHHKMALQSGVNQFSIDKYMSQNQVLNEKECLRHLVEYLNRISTQLLEGLHTKSNKIGCLHNTVI